MKIVAVTAALVVGFASADAGFDCERYTAQCVTTKTTEDYADCAATIAANTDESMSCRIEHLGLIADGVAEDQARHCVHAMEVAEGPCVEETLLEEEKAPARDLPCEASEEDMAEFKIAVQEVGAAREEGRFTSAEIKAMMTDCDFSSVLENENYTPDEEAIAAKVEETNKQREEKAKVEDPRASKDWNADKVAQEKTRSATTREFLGSAGKAPDNQLKADFSGVLGKDLTDEEVKIVKQQFQSEQRIMGLENCANAASNADETLTLEAAHAQCKAGADFADTGLEDSEIERLKTALADKTDATEIAELKEEIKENKKAKSEKRSKAEEEVRMAVRDRTAMDLEECAADLKTKSCFEANKEKYSAQYGGDADRFEVEVEKARKESGMRMFLICEGEQVDPSGRRLLQTDSLEAEAQAYCKGTVEVTLKGMGVSEERLERAVEESKEELLKTTIVSCMELAKEAVLISGGEFDKAAAQTECKIKGKTQFVKYGGDDAATDDETAKKVEQLINKKAGESASDKLDSCTIPEESEVEGQEVTKEDWKESRDICLTQAKEAFENAGGDEGKYLQAVEDGKRAKGVDWFCGCVEEEKIKAVGDSGGKRLLRRLLQDETEEALIEKMEMEIILDAAKTSCKGKAKEALAKVGVSEEQYEDEKEEIEKRMDNSFEKIFTVEKPTKKRVRAVVKLEEVKDAAADTASEGKTRKTFDEIKTGLNAIVVEKSGTKTEDVKPSAFMMEKEQVLMVKFTEKCKDDCDKTEVKDADKTMIEEAVLDIEIVKDGKVYRPVVVVDEGGRRRLLQDDDSSVESTQDSTECTDTSACDLEEDVDEPPVDESDTTTISDDDDDTDGGDDDEPEDYSAAYTPTPAIFAAAVSMLFLTQA